ncbi:TolC family protein [Mangrovimonas sp. ST2L15]|uniref:TolC family protein n=1 Tax=Mangrovimonas sp. ST2L15 TaxID=1645916 RepID=UPI0006B6972D|nr:TolC family protein [Mangrovimonas sp. ST2L15]
MKQLITLFILVTMLFSSKGRAQQLQSYIDEAWTNNPEIAKFEVQYQIVSEKVNEVNVVPNTEFGVGYFVSEPETRTGAQRFKVSAKQMLPWFGTITSRETYMNLLADAKYEDVVIAKRQLMASVAQSYYRLYANKAKQSILLENIDLLETYETMALTFVEVGKASAVDVLKLQMRKNDMQQLIEVLQQQYVSEQTTFNKLLNKEKNEEINVVSVLFIPSEEVDVNTEDLKVHPELIKYDKLFQSVEQSELLNQKESSPMIGFGLDYINVEKRPDMTFSDNGKDIIMPMVSLSIPIFNNRYKSVSKQNEFQQQQINYQKQERLNVLETRLDQAINERHAARISFDTQSKNLKQANNAEDILIKNYETGTIDFNDLLDIQELQFKFEVNQIEAVKAYYVQSTIINYLTNRHE